MYKSHSTDPCQSYVETRKSVCYLNRIAIIWLFLYFIIYYVYKILFWRLTGILYIVYDNFEMANLAQCLVSENTNYSSAAGTNSNDQKTAYAFDIIKGMEYLAKNEVNYAKILFPQTMK